MTLDEKVLEIIREHTARQQSGREVKCLDTIDIIFALEDAKFRFYDDELNIGRLAHPDELDAALAKLEEAGKITHDTNDHWTAVL